MHSCALPAFEWLFHNWCMHHCSKPSLSWCMQVPTILLLEVMWDWSFVLQVSKIATPFLANKLGRIKENILTAWHWSLHEVESCALRLCCQVDWLNSHLIPDTIDCKMFSRCFLRLLKSCFFVFWRAVGCFTCSLCPICHIDCSGGAQLRFSSHECFAQLPCDHVDNECTTFSLQHTWLIDDEPTPWLAQNSKVELTRWPCQIFMRAMCLLCLDPKWTLTKVRFHPWFKPQIRVVSWVPDQELLCVPKEKTQDWIRNTRWNWNDEFPRRVPLLEAQLAQLAFHRSRCAPVGRLKCSLANNMEDSRRFHCWKHS